MYNERFYGVFFKSRFLKPHDWSRVSRPYRSRRLRFDKRKPLIPKRNNKIDFKALPVPEIVNIPAFARVQLRFRYLACHKAFKECAVEWRVDKRMLGFNA